MRQGGPVEPGVLGARLRQQQILEDPQYGELEPLSLEGRGTLWPHPANWALIELTAVTESSARRLEEYRFTPTAGAALPVALLFERTPNGASRARIYSTSALRTSHSRSLVVDAHLAPGPTALDALGRWTAAMLAGDLKAAQALFASDATLQDGEGRQYRDHAGIVAALPRLALRGPDAPRYYTRLDQGPHSALELQLPSGKPALLASTRDAGGLLSSLRIYA